MFENRNLPQMNVLRGLALVAMIMSAVLFTATIASRSTSAQKSECDSSRPDWRTQPCAFEKTMIVKSENTADRAPDGTTNLQLVAATKVAIESGGFYTSGLHNYLAGLPEIASVTDISACDLATLSQYDVVILYGNQNCFDGNAFSAYVNNGGGIVATPWVNQNNGGFAAEPVSGGGGNAVFRTALNVTVTDASDPLLQGVSFVGGNSVGYEGAANLTLRSGATNSVLWNNNSSQLAVSKWAYGSGRSVYLNFHYITSDCDRAIDYGWGQQLMRNAVNWAANPNTLPAVTPGLGQAAFQAASTSFMLGSFTDPDGAPWAADIDWGDGTPHSTFAVATAGTLGALNHAYTGTGIFSVSVKVTDTPGASDTKSFQVTVSPIPVTVIVPPGVSYDLNGTAYAGTQTVDLAPGSYTLSTTSPQSLGAGSRAVFQNWSDSGAISHQITVPSSPLSITGTFVTQYQLTTAAGSGGMVSPASGSFYDTATVVPVSATPNIGFNFGSWTGPVATTSSASTTVTMDAPKSITANFLGPASMTANALTTPQTAMVYTAFASPLAVTVRDSANNPVSGVNVVFTAPGSGASGKFSNNTQTITVTTNASGIATAPFTANSTVGGPYNVTAASNGLTNANFSLTNIGGPATHFSITAPANVTAGTPFNFTVTALDADNNVSSAYAGSVHFTSTDYSPADLPVNVTLVSGVGTFSARLFKGGIQTIDAYDLANFSINGSSNNINVGAGQAYGFRITAPANVMPGIPFNFTAAAVDAYNNPGAFGTGTVVFSSTDGLATVPANTILINGIGTFSATLRTAGGWAILAKDISLPISGSSNNINVASIHFAVSAPSTATVGTPFSFKVTAQDLFNNTLIGYTGTVHFTSTDGSATLPADSTLTNGVGTFNATLGSTGGQTIIATDTNASTVKGTSNGISVSSSFTVRSPFDFDGDGKTDISVFRPADGTWYLNQSQAGFAAIKFGMSDDVLVPADFTGDGKTDIAVWRPSEGTWYVLRSENSTFYGFGFGADGDIPAPADYDGDGMADMAVYRPGEGMWYLQQTKAGFAAVRFGMAEDKPTIGDFDGDRKYDIALYRPSNGDWYCLNSSDGSFTSSQFGATGDMIVPGDFDGDGKTDLAVYRPGNSTWYIAKPGGPPAQNFNAVQFGTPEDIPVPGDYDGDRRADVAVFRPSDGTWYIMQSNSGFTAMQFGAVGDRPTPGAYVFW